MSDLLERLRAALADRYAIESEIGRGGMAVVFLAEDLKHHRQVALKVLHSELTATLGAERFLHEIEIVAGLQHPHILPLYDSGESDGLLYYVMPFARGESLRQRLDREKQLAVDESVRIAVEVADGLDYAHRQGVVHRDIKPGNILLSEKHAVIADFGIARAIEAARAERVTQTGLGVGTPLYASPEQATAEETLDGRTDIYSLGCMLYEMLAGDPPLTGATPQMTHARRMSETPTQLHTLRDTVPPALDHVIGRALAKIPADRYATASQFGQALQAVLFAATPAAHADLAMTPGPMATTPTTIGPEPTTKPRRWWLIVAFTAAIAFVGAWYLATRTGTDTSEYDAIGEADAVSAERLTRNGRITDVVISPDGSHVATAATGPGGGSRIAVSEIGAAQSERTLVVVDDLWSLMWRPDGSGIVFRGTYMGQQGAYSTKKSGGTVEGVPLGLAPWIASRSGSECLLWAQPWKVVRIVSRCDDRGELRWPEGVDSIPVAGDYEWLMDAEWSPRGDYFLIATSSGSGSSSVRAVSRSGEDQRVVVDGAEPLVSMHWRDDGRVLYYSRRLQAGAELMRLSTKPNGEPEAESESILQLGDSLVVRGISADSRRLVVVKTISESRVVRLQTDGGEPVSVAPVTGTEDVQSFWVSPDGEWIAFIAQTATGSDIYKIPIAGGSPKRLTSSGNINNFSWSPDGQLLAFSAPWRGSKRVWLVSSDGGPSTPLQESKTSGHLSWAPGPLMYQMQGNRNYWVIDSMVVRTGDGIMSLTPANLEASRVFVEGAYGGLVESYGRALVTNDSVGFIFAGKTSPDGQWAAVFWNRSPEPGLWRISLWDSTQVPVLAETRATRHMPVGWTTDGTGILASAGEDILLIPLSTGEPETVLTLPDTPDYWCDPFHGSEYSWVCIEAESESDAWLIEDFDPHVN